MNSKKLYAREDGSGWYHAVQSNDALVTLADEGYFPLKISTAKNK